MKAIIKLHFTAPLHIANSRTDYAQSESYLHSDTLYSAIMQTWSVLSHTAWIPQKESETLDFTLSSAFPFTSELDVKGQNTDQTVYFFPRIAKPFNFQGIDDDDLQDSRKKIKKIQWLDSFKFKQQLTDKKGCLLETNNLKGKYLTAQMIDPHFIDSTINAHAAISRSGGDAEPYVMERLQFKKGSGFYFIFDGTAEALNQVQLALNLMQYDGIGSDRNTGNGRFRCETNSEENHLVLTMLQAVENQVNDKKYATNLSLLLPENEDYLAKVLPDNDTNCAFELIRRGGWVTSLEHLARQKNSVFLFKEGGVFHYRESISGGTINLQPDIMKAEKTHPIWRVGKSLWLPCTF